MIKINYIDLKCGVCGKDFQESDDVVVCPDCGTPMHRNCYKENNGCPNTEKHSEDFVFEGFEQIKQSAQGKKKFGNKTSEKASEPFAESNETGNQSYNEIVCPFCGEKNKKSASFCNQCGAKFLNVSDNGQNVSASKPPQQAPIMMDPLAGIPASAEFEEDVNAADLACYVSVNTPYYLRAFDLIKRKAGKFNFSAAVFSGVWLLYRKQYKIGGIVFSLEILLYALRYYFSLTYSMNILNKLLYSIGLSTDSMSSLSMEQSMQLASEMQKLSVNDQILVMLPSMLLILQIIMMIVIGFIGNKLYYKHCVNKIQTIKKAAKSEALSNAETAQIINLSGGVNSFVAGIFGLIYLAIFLF